MFDRTKTSPQDNLNRTVSLPDGRLLGYAEYGDPQGYPIFYFHGGNSSRLEAAWIADAAAVHHIRLIAPDRPGFGLSDPQPERTILSWAADVESLANALSLTRFAVMGLSGGGPHAAVVARQRPERVTAAAIISGPAPPEVPNRFKGMFLPVRLNLLAARYVPFLSRWFLAKMGGSYADPEKFLNMVKRGIPTPDRELAEQRPEAIQQFCAAAVESHRQGVDGDFIETQLYSRMWGFRLSEISVPVALWYGEVDNFVPPAMGHYYASQIPKSTLHIVPDGGHFSTINNYVDAILAELLDASHA